VILLPAVDISEGKAVRLSQGRFDRATVYRDRPVEAAQSWADAGARFLHIVDLDGARAGHPVSLGHLEEIANAVDIPIQYGGGLRTLGTAAYTDVDFLDDVMAAFDSRVIVSVDVADGTLSTSGWTKRTQIPPGSVIERLQGRGVRTFVYTSVDRDGMLEGPDPDEVRAIAETVRGRFLYAGGIGDLEHLRTLADLRAVNLAGVIVGKALYEGRFTIEEAHAVLDGR